MSAGSKSGSLWVQRVPGLGDVGIWVVSHAGRESLQRPAVQEWILSADRIFTERAEVASISVVPSEPANGHDRTSTATGIVVAEASEAALPLCFLSGRIADLIGLSSADDQQHRPVARFEQWIETATLKGLVHLWLAAAPAVHAGSGLATSTRTVPSLQRGDRTLLVSWRPLSDESVAQPHAISLGIDAAWLLAGESGAQVFVFEMVREMVRRPEIARVVFLSNGGAVPQSLSGTPKISGASWSDVRAGRVPRLDILHRPYQPGADVDFRHYHQAARCVAITVLDFIAYDNPSYHESRSSWRQYQRAFDEKVCLADGVFAISRYVGERLERQFAHQLSGPVRSVYLGTDHLNAPSVTESPVEPGSAIASLEHARFLLVLGNDFEHKNRDFAVKVFRDMCARGYDGHLVLAGFHLDGGSSFDHELVGAEDWVDRIVRVGAVSGPQKVWLLRRAQAVLYPTSSEGFGLIPFEAAALGTPTAFVTFGPLRETLHGVSACSAWHVRSFADHVFSLIANPSAQLEQIRAASVTLTWERCVDQMLEGYRAMLSDSTLWQTEKRVVRTTGLGKRMNQTMTDYARRAARKVRRLALR